MDTHQTPNKTPSNFLETLPKDIRDVVHKKNQIPGSPFASLPHHTTPPSRYFVTKNPFEVVMNDHLHKHIWSPSVFQEGKTPINSEKFKWNIEEISSLNPANIDVSSTTQFEHVHANSEDDVHVQAKIERYFRETQIAPSPWNEDIKHAPLLPEEEGSPDVPASEVVEEVTAKDTETVWTQTELSLPPVLPEELENALKPFFTFTEDQRAQSVDLDSSLRRRLFHFESPRSDDIEYVSDHEKLSEVGSPVMNIHPNCNNRTFGSSPISDLIPDDLSPIHNSTPQKLNNCPISPISTLNIENEQMREEAAAVQTNEDDNNTSAPSLRLRRSFGSFAKADFSGHMSVDNSFNLAPENDRVDVGNDTNLSESPVRSNEFMESCNWDLEYNNISLNGRPIIRRTLFEKKRNSNTNINTNTEEHMDISNNHTTPKSKIINSQRKKLSDSFKLGGGGGGGGGETSSMSDNEHDEEDDDDVLNFDYVDDAEEEEEEEGQLRKRFCDKYNEADAEADVEIEIDNFTFSQNTQDTGYNTCPESSHNRLLLLSYTKDEDMIVSDQQNQHQLRNPNIFASTPSKGYFSKVKE